MIKRANMRILHKLIGAKKGTNKFDLRDLIKVIMRKNINMKLKFLKNKKIDIKKNSLTVHI